MTDISRQEAQAIVDDIREQNGGITEEDRRQASLGMLRSYDNLRGIAGASTRFLAKELYSTNTRFVFELIQNAEDNNYSDALGRDERPFLSFTLSHDRIIIDSNEDGFNERNVRAICSVGKSTKQPTGGYVGHKGIGFKSVFKIAYKVHIQSGPFSFYFEHRQGDSGMGMITPHNEAHQILDNGVSTRMTLFLIGPDEFSDRVSEFAQIPDTLILFLLKLEKISVRVEPREGPSLITSYERHENEPHSTLKLIKIFNGAVEESFYHVEKRTLPDLPKESSRRGRRSAEVILAFPIDSDSRPVIRTQYVYSFLPLRQEGLNFLVQSDFITQANREGIRHCPWNDAIRDGVCEVFVDAVRKFCSQPTLKYKWLAYLPGLHVADPFWRPLREMVIAKLKDYEILFTRKGNLAYPEDLQRLSTRHCDQHGDPLFDDMDPEIYLSPKYSWAKDKPSLTALGVTNISYRNLLARLDRYLRGPRPRLLEPTFDDDWHTRVANLLLRAMRSSPSIKGRIKKMDLIPLSGGLFSVNDGTDIYFPDDSAGNAIPTDLDLHIVAREALQNEARRSLFEMLGVDHQEPDFLIDRIRAKYNRHHSANLDNSISHLRYLYWSLTRDKPLDGQIFLIDQQGVPIYRRFVTFGREIVVDDLYFETPGEYGTKQLAENIESGAREQGIEGVEMHFIHESYIDAVPSDARSNGRSWGKWLEDMASVRRVPKFKKSATSNRLSKLFRHVVNSQSDLLIGLLKTYWPTYEREITPDIAEEIKDTEVQCQGGELYPLRCTHFPSAELRQLCSQATVSDHFPFFLVIPPTWATDTTVDWEFLGKFGIGMQPDLGFFEDIFLVLTENLTPNQAQRGLFTLYKELSERFHRKRSAEIRDLFNKYSAVCIPADATRAARSTILKKCVWNGLRCLRSKNPLAIYEEYTRNSDVEYLFRTMLRLQDASRTTYVTELKSRKRSLDESLEDLRTIYEEIANIRQDEKPWSFVRDQIEEHSLIYVPSEGSWHPPTSCVWASAPRIGRQFGISAPYEHLENFFVEILSIQTPTTSTYVEQLQILVEERTPDIRDIKAAIENISQLRPTTSDLDGIRRLRCLPVKMTDGATELASTASQFFIVDRIKYETEFQGKVPILDFSMEEVRKSHIFLEAMGLRDRYMSSAVEETTTVQQPAQEPSASLTRAFRQKSKYFYRCVIHFDGGRTQDNDVIIYRKFQNATVYESDGFRKTLRLSQGGLVATAESSRGMLHLEEVDERLRLFVPRDSQQREECYAGQLPNSLVRYLGFRDPAAAPTFGKVILAPAHVLGEALDEDGIVGLPNIDIFDLESNTPEESRLDDLAEGRNTLTPTSSEDWSSIAHRSQSAGPRPIPIVQRSPARTNSSPAEGRSEVPEPRYEPRPSWPSTSDAQYLRVLENVIETARRAVFPSAETWDLQDLVGALPSTGGSSLQGSPFGVRSQNQIAHDIRIGAAGELYIFELLLQLDLPGFGRPNWRSNIRDEVNIHPEYHDLDSWGSAETADIVYNDSNSILTRLLVASGYLPPDQWESACPEYFIEVKSTPGACETQFYMSKSQYRRMQSMRLPAAPSPNTRIYVIFRVFNLGRDNMSVRVYVDPESLRQTRRLQFTPESYTVTPARPSW